MKKKRPSAAHRIAGARAPEQTTAPMWKDSEGANESLQQRLLRLEKELEEARLRADLYEEIINVAEKKFDIQIRKKAGTKQRQTCMRGLGGIIPSGDCADCLVSVSRPIINKKEER